MCVPTGVCSGEKRHIETVSQSRQVGMAVCTCVCVCVEFVKVCVGVHQKMLIKVLLSKCCSKSIADITQTRFTRRHALSN